MIVYLFVNLSLYPGGRDSQKEQTNQQEDQTTMLRYLRTGQVLRCLWEAALWKNSVNAASWLLMSCLMLQLFRVIAL